MHVDDMILISIDDHSIEPPDMFEQHMPAKYRDVASFFHYDPFAHLVRADATVGKLRAHATGVDTSTTSKAEYRPRYELAHASG
jgi:hypothetical protein